MPIKPVLLTVFAAVLLTACAGRPEGGHLPEQAPEADRRAILAMAGEFAVRFDFRETLALAQGYTPHEPHVSEARELVFVLEERPDFIALQHLLLTERGRVVKHWRQDWQYQPVKTWQYRGDYRWSHRSIAPEQAAGQWSQTVWQVDDSPRYAALGRWHHGHGVSSWTSEPTQRPLPRREHTTRNDYDTLLGLNRHTLTPQGWLHEQSNYKIDSRRAAGSALLAHELGLNTYTRLTDVDFSPAREYWQKTAAYWAAVRTVWADLLHRHTDIGLKQPRHGSDQADEDGLPEDAHFMVILRQANELGVKNLNAEEYEVAVRQALQPFLRLD